jgi:hypothetical protein
VHTLFGPFLPAVHGFSCNVCSWVLGRFPRGLLLSTPGTWPMRAPPSRSLPHPQKLKGGPQARQGPPSELSPSYVHPDCPHSAGRL